MTPPAAQTAIDALKADGILPADFALSAAAIDALSVAVKRLQTDDGSQESAYGARLRERMNLRDATPQETGAFLDRLVRQAVIKDTADNPITVALNALVKAGIADRAADIELTLGYGYIDIQRACRELRSASTLPAPAPVPYPALISGGTRIG